MAENKNVISRRVKFVSYDGHYPNLCSGTLVLEINGKTREMPEYCMIPGGYVGFTEDYDEYVKHGPWRVEVPADLEPYREEIEQVVNENVPQGCCGGCI